MNGKAKSSNRIFNSNYEDRVTTTLGNSAENGTMLLNNCFFKCALCETRALKPSLG